MAVYKCKMCGGTIEVAEGQKVVTCEYCGATQTVHSFDNEKKTTFFKRAEALRFKCEFDKAAGVYETIVSEFPHEAEAYWGLVLCKYGIEYVDDPKTGKKIPTCHRTQFASIYEDADYMNVLKYADVVAKSIYEKEAKEISKLQKSILDISSKEDPFDIFICYKENDSKGNRTNDSVLAEDIYDELVNKGYRVFFSRITLEDKLGTQYEPYIFAALHSAKIMLHVTTSETNSEAVWVRNEWSRFLSLIADGQKKTLIPCYKGISPYDLPEEMQNLQGQDMSKIGAMQDLLRGIDKILSRKAPTKVETKTIVETRGPSSSYEGLVKKGHTYLKNNKFEEADRTFDEAIRIGEMPGEAYLGKVLVEYQFCSIEEVMESASEEVVDCDNFTLAKEFANKEFAETLKKIEDKVRYNRLKENYDSAMAQYNRGDLESLSLAMDNFRVLEDFEDSPKMVKECIYKTGLVYLGMVTSISNLNYCEDATKCFEDVIDFKNSREMITKVAETRNSIIESYKNSCLSKLIINYPKDVTNGSLKALADKVLLNRNIIKTFSPLYKDILEKQKEIEAEADKFIVEKSPALIDTFNQKGQCNNLRQICKSIEVNDCFKSVYELLNKKENELSDIARATAKKRRKKTLKISAIVCGALAVIVATVFGVKAIVDENNRKATYASAIKAMESGNYDEAITYYESLGDYQESQKKIKVCNGLKQLEESITTKKEADAIKGIKTIVSAGESVTANYSDSNGKVLRKKSLANGNSTYTEVIDNVDFTLYQPVANPGYTFSHWNSINVNYKDNMTNLGLNSNWSVNEYRITYVLDGGTNSVSNPTKYTVETPTIDLENATKANYQFLGWFDSATEGNKITKIELGSTGDITLYARFEINKYTVQFVDYDNTLLYETIVEHGSSVTYPYSDPVRQATQQYTYTFTGWSQSTSNITSDLVCVAQYSSTVNQYTVTFLNYDGSYLGSDTVDYGSPAHFNGTPIKPQTDEYSYYFKSWDKDISQVTEDFSTTATYTQVVRHNVTFLDYNGTTLWTTKVDHGSGVTYGGGTVPSRPATQQYTYTFANWDGDLTNIQQDTVFNPVFTPTVNKYTVTFKNYNGSTLQTSSVEYGSYASYSGSTPTKPATQQYSYSFSGWDKDPSATIIYDDTTFTAQYSSSVNKYSITFKNYDESVLGTSTVEYGSNASYNGNLPTRTTDYLKYTFTGNWTTTNGGSTLDDLTSVTSNRTVYAQYDTEGYSDIVTTTHSNSAVGLTPDGRFAVWGNNERSNLSATAGANIYTPIELDFDLSEIKQVAIGTESMLVLTNDGDIYARGKNDYGQLGLGHRNDVSEFTKIEGIPKFKYITANGVYSGGISVDGYIYLWGYDPGLFDSVPQYQTTPKMKVMNTAGSSSPGYNNNTWVDLKLGAGFAQCTTESGALWAFGRNYFGEVGDGTVAARIDDNAQHYEIAEIAFNGKTYGWNLSKISCGGDHTMALHDDGNVYVWGLDLYGECLRKGTSGVFSEGTRYYAPTPIKVKNYFSSIGNIIDIAAGCHFSTTLNDNGEVYIWGENVGGVLGVPYSDLKYTTTPMKISYPEKIVKICASGYTIFAFGESGIVYSSGSNDHGICGNGDSSVSINYSPVKCLYLD